MGWGDEFKTINCMRMGLSVGFKGAKMFSKYAIS